jgi:RNA polymerase-interacting CarD/CdnL/TRCF family regulator
MRWGSRTRVQPRPPEERLASLTVGDLVVYGSYGLGRVAVKETRAVGGAAREVVVVELGESLSVTLPLERALGCLRLVADQGEIEAVQRILRGSVVDEQAWQKRLRDAREKVVDGTLVGLAEVVRDSACREARTRAGGARLSTAEHGLYTKARQLLAAEIGCSLGIPTNAADDWIDEQLAEATDKASTKPPPAVAPARLG